MSGQRRLFISAGEVSGEHHAARVVKSLRKLDPELSIDSMGGRHLEAAGTRMLFPLSDFAVLGFRAAFQNLGRFISILARYSNYLDRERPDAVVLVDYPGLHVRFAALAKRRGIPVVYYVCPQLWAWAPWRAGRFAKFVDHALTILPFEERYFALRGIQARYVGHPAADELAEPAGPIESVGRARDESDRQLCAASAPIALLPGSRPQEARANLPLMLDVVSRLENELGSLEVFLPQARDDTREVCRKIVADHGISCVRIVDEVRPVLARAHFALVASGTVTFEVAYHGVPMVVLYRITRLQSFLGRQLLTVPWISQVNLIAGRELVPEFVTCGRPLEQITRACLELFRDTRTRAECRRALTETLRDAFQPGASDRAAQAILKVLDDSPALDRAASDG